MKIYNAAGYTTLLLYAGASAYFAPPHLGPLAGLAVGAAYLLAGWFLAGVYLSCVIHLGIAHRALDYQDWFVKGITIANNTFGVYINPISWVNRHRLHHRFADHPGDPNKLGSDGFWRTLFLCLFPYRTQLNVANDAILRSRTMRIVANPIFVVAAQPANFLLLWWLVGDLPFTVVMWLGLRVFGLWVNMIQNYWSHDRRFGYRRYDDEGDNAMNIGDWLPVTVTFSACLQNNHHHAPALLRLSHEDSEYDFGLKAVRTLKALGLVRATTRGVEMPKDIPLRSLNF